MATMSRCSSAVFTVFALSMLLHADRPIPVSGSRDVDGPPGAPKLVPIKQTSFVETFQNLVVRQTNAVKIVAMQPGLTCVDLMTVKNTMKGFKNVVGYIPGLGGHHEEKTDPSLSGIGHQLLQKYKDQKPENFDSNVDMVFAASNTASVWTAAKLFSKPGEAVEVFTVPFIAPKESPDKAAVLDGLQKGLEATSANLVDFKDTYTVNYRYEEAFESMGEAHGVWPAFKQFLEWHVLPRVLADKGDGSPFTIGVVMGADMLEKAGCKEATTEAGASFDFTWTDSREASPSGEGVDAHDTSPFYKLSLGEPICKVIKKDAGSNIAKDTGLCNADLGFCREALEHIGPIQTLEDEAIEMQTKTIADLEKALVKAKATAASAKTKKEDGEKEKKPCVAAWNEWCVGKWTQSKIDSAKVAYTTAEGQETTAATTLENKKKEAPAAKQKQCQLSGVAVNAAYVDAQVTAQGRVPL